MGLWSKAGTVGVDIGARTLKAVSLKKSRGKVALDKYFFLDLAEGNELYPIEAPVIPLLQAMVNVHGFSGFQAASCLSDKDVLTHDMTLPQMPQADFELAVRSDLEEQFGLTAEQAVFDHVLLGAPDDGAKDAQVYKIYCSKKESVEKLRAVFSELSLKLTAVDSGVLSQVATLAHNGYLSKGEDVALLDIGESRVTASLLRGEKVMVTNVLNVGFGNINQVLFETQGLTYDRAEALKRTYSMQTQEGEADELHTQIDEVLSDILYKVHRLLQTYRLRATGKSIGRIYITGGGSQLPHLDEAVKTYCGIPSEIINPFKNIEIYSSANAKDNRIATLAPYMTTAIGLALRSI